MKSLGWLFAGNAAAGRGFGWAAFALWRRAMNSTTGLGSFGAVGKCPAPSWTTTVICPPRSL